jgi:dienelactone hydrolase
MPAEESSAIHIRVEPAEGRVDASPVLVVEGLRPGADAWLTLATTDAGGHAWRSCTRCRVAPDGVLELSDHERPWWNMTFEDRDVAPVAFQAPDSALDYELEVALARGGGARATVRRLWADGVAREDLAGDGWRMRLYRPRSAGRSGVVVIPGSTGAAAIAPLAALLASHGYVTGVLAYMQEPGLPSTFREIPLEALDAGIRAFAAAAALHQDRISVLAASVGTAAALSCLSGDDAPAVAAVVVIAPTSVVWQALGEGGPPPKVSSLTRQRRELPYVPIRGEKLLGQILRGAVLARFDRRRSRAIRLLPAFAGDYATRMRSLQRRSRLSASKRHCSRSPEITIRCGQRQ